MRQCPHRTIHLSWFSCTIHCWPPQRRQAPELQAILSTSFDDGHSVPLIAVSSNDSSASGASDYSSSVNDAALETTAGSATTAPAVFLVPSNSGSGWIALQSIAVGPVDVPSGHFDGPQLPVQFNGSFAQLRGTLDASQPAMSYEIPIGPSTQSLGVSVRPASDMPPGEVPVIDGMSLVDSTGNTLEQVSPADDSGGSPSAAVLVQLHDPPAGDRIVVDIGAVEPTSSSPTSTSSTSSGLGSGVVTTPPLSQSASWSVPFVLDVQRQQQSSVSTADALSVVPGTDTIGTLIVASAQPPVLFASSSSPSAPAEQDGSTSLYVQPTNTAAAQASASETESTDSFNLRVPTGPLASRSGGALGPTLALVDAEATQPVNRLERALTQDLMGADDGELTAAKGNGAGDQEILRRSGHLAGFYRHRGDRRTGHLDTGSRRVSAQGDFPRTRSTGPVYRAMGDVAGGAES